MTRLYDWAAEPDQAPTTLHPCLEDALADVLGRRLGLFGVELKVTADELALVARPFALAELLRRLAECSTPTWRGGA